MPRRLKNWIETYTSTYTEDTESAPVFHKWIAVSMLSAVLRKKTWFKFGRFPVYPNLYIVLVGEPGIARKTQAISYGTRLINEVSGISVSADSTTREALITDLEGCQVVDPMPDGSNFTHSSVTIISREFESFLGQKKENTKMLVLLTDLYDCEELPWKYRTKSSGSNTVPAVYLNLLAATTPESLASSLPPTAIGGGLTSRMIFVWASNRGKKIPIPEDPPAEVRDNLIRDLNIISRYTGAYQFSQPAREEWIKWYEIYDERSTHRICKDPAFNGWYSRKPMLVIKLATILQAAEGPEQLIEWRFFQKAIDLLEEIEDSMGKTFTAIGRSNITVDVDLVMNIVKRVRVISEKDLLESTWRDIDSRKFDNVADTAIRAGCITRKFRSPTGEQGIWYVWTGKD